MKNQHTVFHDATVHSCPYKNLTNSCQFACSITGNIYM